MVFLVAQTIKNQPSILETRVRSLGQEDPLEKGIATHSSILSWRTPWTEEPGGLQSMGSDTIYSPRVRQDRATNTFTFTKYLMWKGCGHTHPGLIEKLAPEEKLAPWIMHQVEENMDKSQLSDEQDLVNSLGNEHVWSMNIAKVSFSLFISPFGPLHQVSNCLVDLVTSSAM